MAQESAVDTMPRPAWRWFLEGGTMPGTRSAHVGLIVEAPRRWQLGPIIASGYLDASVGRWQVETEERDGRAGFTQVSLTPVARAYASAWQQAFVEVGVGANVIGPRFRTVHKRFGSTFNFGDHVGAGWRSAGRNAWELSVRYEHFSNAGFSEPNPGANFVELRLGAAF